MYKDSLRWQNEGNFLEWLEETEALAAQSTLAKENAPAAMPTLPDHKGPDVLPEVIKAYLEEKMRPYHNRISFQTGAIELWEYLQAHQSGVPASLPMTSKAFMEWCREQSKHLASRDKDFFHMGAVMLYTAITKQPTETPAPREQFTENKKVNE